MYTESILAMYVLDNKRAVRRIHGLARLTVDLGD